MTARQGVLRQRAYVAFRGAERRGCCEHGCRLGLGGIRGCTVLKGEDIAEGGGERICECVIIHATKPPRVVLVELKSGGAKLDQVFEKFSNAVGLLSKIKQDVFVGEEYDVTMLLLVGRRRRRSLYAMCGTREFTIGGKRRSILVLPCGTHLADVYKKLAGQRAGPRPGRSSRAA